MSSNRKIFYVVLVGLAICAGFGVVNLARRASFPYQLKQTPDGFRIIATTYPGTSTSPLGKILSRVDHLSIKHTKQIEALLERRLAGDVIVLTFSDGDTISVRLSARNSTGFVVVSAVLGAAFFLIAWIVYHRAQRKGDRYFAVSAMLFGYIIAIGGTGLTLPEIISIPLNALYFLSYPQTFLVFLYFCYNFPSPVLPDASLQFRKRVLQIAGMILSVILAGAFFIKTANPTVAHVLLYEQIYRVFRAVILLVVFISFAVLFKNLRRKPTPENYRKVYWLIWGIFAGSAPFLLLWNLPQLLGYPPLLPEWLVTLWLVIIPVSIAIAIIKYRLFDIEIILSRSIVYSTVISFLLGGYVILVGGLSLLLYRQFSLQSHWLSLAAALLIAFAFQPLRQQITREVNRKFFRIRYDRFLAMKSLLTDLENCYTPQLVLDTLQRQFAAVVPVQRSFFCLKEGEEWMLPQLSHKEKEQWKEWLSQNIQSTFPAMLINQDAIHQIEEPGGARQIPFPGEGGILLSVGDSVLWCLGKKLSGMRFWQEDTELAFQMSHAAALQLEKVKYFQRSLQETMEKERAQQLSRWKSLLVAEVAHDLRAHLNTILWKLKNFNSELPEDKGKTYQPAEDIRKQIQNLQSFIQTLLIMPQIEEGKYRLQWQMVPVKTVLEEILSQLEGVISAKQLLVTVECPGNLAVGADPTLLKEILLNLVDNAAKFSPAGKRIAIQAAVVKRDEKEWVQLAISDEAGGIPPGQQHLVFEPFQEKDGEEKRIHLGLYIAREFTRLMGGELQLKSDYGKGTRIEVYLGVEEKQTIQDLDTKRCDH